MGVQYVTWMRETWDTLRAVRRRAPVRRGQGEARAARDRRGRAGATPASTTGASSAAGDIPVDGGPLSAKIAVDGKEIGGFDLSAASYTIPVAAGGSPTITQVSTADPAARARDRLARRRRSRAGRREGHQGPTSSGRSSRTTCSTSCPTRRCGACGSTASRSTSSSRTCSSYNARARRRTRARSPTVTARRRAIRPPRSRRAGGDPTGQAR